MAKRTLGGLQFWNDWRWNQGWRLQRYWRGERCRVLDPENRLVMTGSWEQCVENFESASPQQTPPGEQQLVLILHGMNRTRQAMRGLAQGLSAAGFATARLSYASTRQKIAESARALASVVQNAPFQRISFVGHSMGNLVVRHFFGDLAGNPHFAQGGKTFEKMVMIAPPNQGSKMARWLKFSLLFNLISGTGGREFSWRWNEVKPGLATPPMSFGVIAGTQKSRWFSNPFLPGTDDWTVALAETELSGEADRLEDFFLHGTIMKDPRVIQATIRFIQTGQFRELQS